MGYRFSSEVSRGAAKGEPMEPWLDKDGNFVLFDPAKRREGSVHEADYSRTRSSEQAKKLIENDGVSMRMRIRGAPSSSPSLVKAERIVITPR